ncbi:hypothetical protein ACIPSE_03265 [Streptomyces sp. NPDC090106]|uniref:hypothetical protein n=1 Tax=Streptomyces sp. NPDC090106 TaxID=3365946 RepID=UPI003822C770
MRRDTSGVRGGCRRPAATAGVLAGVLALVLAGAGPASAGGPTSVLIVSPQSAQTAALYNSDEEYGELAELLGEPGRGAAVKPPEADPVGRMINVTWMAHDVSPWRVDQLYAADGTKDVWIHTAQDLNTSANGLWHRAEEPGQLRELLQELGVMGAARGERATAATAPAAGPVHDGGGTGVSPDGADWPWVVPGLVAGAVLALTLRSSVTRLPESARALLRRWRDRERGPRQELRDL